MHRRWTDYLESVPYFQSRKEPRLDRETFIALDAELMALLARPANELDEAEKKRIRDLRRVLLRD